MKRLALLSLALLTVAACKPNVPATGDPIKIGFIGPLTGDVAGLGSDTANGVKMAVEKINANGGVGGRPVVLVAEDGKCTGSDAASAAQKLVNVDKVVAIVGGNCSGETLAAAPIAEAAGVVLMSPTASSPDVTGAGDFVFRDYPSDALKTVAMAALFKEKGFKKVAIISENTDFAQAFRKALKEKLPADAVVFDEVVDPGTKDFRTLMTRLQDVEFDVFFPDGNSDAVIGPMVQQLREAGIEAVAVSHDAADSVTMATTLKDAVEGLLVINVPSTLKDGGFEADFKRLHGDPQYGISFAGYGYDALGVLVEAIGKVGTSGPAIRDYLYEMEEYSGVVGTFHFDDNGDVVGIPYVLKEFKDGEIVTLKDIALD